MPVKSPASQGITFEIYESDVDIDLTPTEMPVKSAPSTTESNDRAGTSKPDADTIVNLTSNSTESKTVAQTVTTIVF